MSLSPDTVSAPGSAVCPQWNAGTSLGGGAVQEGGKAEAAQLAGLCAGSHSSAEDKHALQQTKTKTI